MLIPGDVNIQGDIAVPDSSLFILASKGNINISSNVASIEAYYSSERNILIPSRADLDCSVSGKEDKQLTVDGALVANALKPFASMQPGRVVNERDLCTGNPSTPSLFVKTRLGFLTLMTDFYKTYETKWEEILP